MSTVNGASATSNPAATSSTSTKKSSDTLGKDEFLTLLMTQLQNQDPMSPMQDQDFIAQMAQFSSLEQIKNLTSTMEMMQATTSIGREVEWTTDAGDLQSGIVKEVKIVNGEVRVKMQDSIVSLAATTKHDSYSDIKELIDTTVSWTNAYGQEMSGKVLDVTKDSNGKDFLLVEGLTIASSKISTFRNPSA